MVTHLRAVRDLPQDDATPLRALIYARTSHDPGRRGKSTASQRDYCEREAAYRGWLVVDAVVDDDRSASTRAKREREGWQEVVDRIAAGDVDVLLMWEWSRATRDLAVYVALEKILRERRVLLAYQGDTYDLTKAGDRRRVASDSVEAQYEADRTSERALRAKLHDAEHGRPSGPVPWGYRRIYDDRRGWLLGQEPDPETGPLVRELADRFLAGESLSQLALDMHRRGIAMPKPPRDPSRSRGWTAATVGQVLRSPSIAGLRQHTRDGVRQFYDASWDGIISLDERRRILDILADPSRVLHRGVQPVHLLSHIAVCARCGSPVRFANQRPRNGSAIRYPAYQCDAAGCRGVYIQAPPVDDLVTQAVIGTLTNPASIVALRGSTRSSELDRAAARVRVTELEARLESLAEAFADGTTDAAAYKLAAGKVRDRLAEARAQVPVRRASGSPALRLADADDVAAAWSTLPLEDQRAVVKGLFVVRLHPARVKGQRRWDPSRVELVPVAAAG
ncbi:recombinase family protein [Cellulomonas sp. DKR-3]|uniref:Recombinase family protein n=1 Tax=Cellulomonas fulva TaxID=2835530 RepID=A0ABS5U285_9CELL|nr:recombinase family protein [Cellulomonas fulva]MBT0995494.1 recombinase family protein [Cellulomonas fulva]